MILIGLCLLWVAGRSDAATVMCPCDELDALALPNLRLLEWRLNRLERSFHALNYNKTFGEVYSIREKVNDLHDHYDDLTEPQRKSKVGEIHAQLSDMTSSLDAVSATWERELEPLLHELEQLWLLFDKIIQDNPEYNLKRCMEKTHELEREIEKLKEQLQNCGSGGGDGGEGGNPDDGGNPGDICKPTDGDWLVPGSDGYDGTLNGVCDDSVTDLYNGGGQFTGMRGDSLPLGEINSATCESLSHPIFSYPLMHKVVRTGYSDFWAKNPYPTSEDNRSAIIWKSHYSSSKHYFTQYPDYDSFLENKRSSLLFTGIISSNARSFLQYKNRILWVDKSNIKYRDVSKDTGDKYVTIPADLNAVNMVYNQQQYTNFIDLHADEFGLYIVYANKVRENQLSITLLNDTTLKPVQTWHTNFYKKDICACFMMCGHLVSLTNCNRRLGEGHSHYVFNTRSGHDYLVPATIVSTFGKIDRLSYNPRERLVFGSDNGHLFTLSPHWTSNNGSGGDAGEGGNPDEGSKPTDGDWLVPGSDGYEGTLNGVCDDSVTDLYNGGGQFTGMRGDSMPLGEINSATCDTLSHPIFSYPLMHKVVRTGYSDFWAKNPYPTAEGNRSAIIWKSHYSSSKHYFTQYPDYDSFLENKHSSLLFTGIISSNARSFLQYKNRILWVDKSNIKYRDVSKDTGDKYVTIPADLNAVNMVYNQQQYTNYIDLHADEFGLYIVYANKVRENQLSITLLNDTTLEPVQTWHTNFYKKDICACFMMCGHLVSLTNCNRRLGEGHSHYVFNTRSGHDYIVPATIVSTFGKIDRLSYNPRERLVFGSDNGHLFTLSPHWTSNSS